MFFVLNVLSEQNCAMSYLTQQLPVEMKDGAILRAFERTVRQSRRCRSESLPLDQHDIVFLLLRKQEQGFLADLPTIMINNSNNRTN